MYLNFNLCQQGVGPNEARKCSGGRAEALPQPKVQHGEVDNARCM